MENTSTSTEIRPFRVEVPAGPPRRPRRAPSVDPARPAAPGDSWDYGTPVSYLSDMVERWKAFDWRAVGRRSTPTRTS